MFTSTVHFYNQYFTQLTAPDGQAVTITATDPALVSFLQKHIGAYKPEQRTTMYFWKDNAVVERTVVHTEDLVDGSEVFVPADEQQGTVFASKDDAAQSPGATKYIVGRDIFFDKVDLLFDVIDRTIVAVDLRTTAVNNAAFFMLGGYDVRKETVGLSGAMIQLKAGYAALKEEFLTEDEDDEEEDGEGE